MPTDCQLIVDPPQAGSWNMAVDEWLLHQAADAGVPTLRFYQWAEPTLSLGYFQKYEDRQSHPASLDCPVVRRASGGGALVHDCELTYSLAVPAGHPLAADPQRMYDAAHTALVELLERIVQPREGSFGLCRETARRAGGEPFLCFLRRAKGDVLYQSSTESNPLVDESVAGGGFKLCGSAQRKHRGSVLQHGGVLLERSDCAPELPGIAQLCGVGITAEVLREQWVSLLLEQLANQAGCQSTTREPFSEFDRQEIHAIETAKFANSRWTRRR